MCVCVCMCVYAIALIKQEEVFTMCYFLMPVIKAAIIVVQPPLECIKRAYELLKYGAERPQGGSKGL